MWGLKVKDRDQLEQNCKNRFSRICSLKMNRFTNTKVISSPFYTFDLLEGRVSQRQPGRVPTCLYRHISRLLSDDVLHCCCTWTVYYSFSSRNKMIFVRDIRAPVNSDWSVIAQTSETTNVVFDVRPWLNVTLSLFYRVLLCRAR